MKYFIIGFSALIIEICSTFYIRFVSEGDVYGMMFFAFIGPFLGLPFIGYVVESKTWSERIKMAFSSAFGYLVGSIIVILFIQS
jgi:uncharacterized protein YqgC (DUF456 family)